MNSLLSLLVFSCLSLLQGHKQLPCPDFGVTDWHPVAMDAPGFTACKGGLTEFQFGGIRIAWDDPVCPLFIIMTPAFTETGKKMGARIQDVRLARGLKFNFHCGLKGTSCHQSDSESFGFYPIHIEVGCDQPPAPITLESPEAS